ncbi:MAG: TonB-dependent receptor plug domain-containing protein [Bacteroidales bacterium]
MIRLILISFCYIIWQLALPDQSSGQDSSDTENDILQGISQYSRYVAPQKIYIHTNKNHYHAGDAIWFKSYLLDGINHVPLNNPANLYVDLVSSSGVLMERRILFSEEGIAEGDIALPRDLPDGNYMLRAYTDWMRNFGEEFYYTKYIYIRNHSYANIIPRSEVRSNRRFNRDLERMSAEENIYFFPEGGHIINGIPGKIAFRAIDGLGRGIDARGEIVNEKSEVVATLETRNGGIGSFEFKPLEGSVYKANVSFDGRRARTFELPEIKNAGTGMRLEYENDDLIINVLSSLSPGGEFIVVAHTRGNVVHGESLRLQNGKGQITLNKESFPSGIAHITVFSEYSEPIAERLAFIYHDDELVFYPEIVRQQVADREFYVLNMQVVNKEDNPVEGSFSLSVIATDEESNGFEDNIINTILLNSDLKGIVESPGAYFNNKDDLSESLDNLMLTHGWRRFEWNKALSGEVPDIRYPPASSLSISGKVLHPSNDQPMPNFPVSLDLFKQQGEEYTTNTDTRGSFTFDGLTFNDNVRIRLYSDRKVSNTPPVIEFNRGEIRDIGYAANINMKPKLITSRGNDWERNSDAGISPYADRSVDNSAPQQYGVPDQTVFLESDSKQTSMYDILITRIRGLNHNMQFRGPTSFSLSNTPMFMIDGVQTSQQAFMNMDPRYVERLEVFSGPRASVFGVRGASGAILGYSRRAGDFNPVDYDEYLIQGYHSPREYYSDLVSYKSPDQEGVNELSIYWDPMIVTDESGNASIVLPPLNTSGLIKFVIEGTGLNGGLGYGVFSILTTD